MPRHTFKFPCDVIQSIKQHVRQAIAAVEPKRFRQEANYTAALVNRLGGSVYEGKYGSVVFCETVFDDRARNSAEWRFGADCAITALISDGSKTIRKAILVQAKLGYLTDLSPSKMKFLREQITKMKQLVKAPKVMQILEIEGKRHPQIISGNQILDNRHYVPMDLADYFVARITTTLDGCTSPGVVSRVQDSSLPTLDIVAKLHQKA